VPLGAAFLFVGVLLAAIAITARQGRVATEAGKPDTAEKRPVEKRPNRT
jgi:hypothetical protein